MNLGEGSIKSVRLFLRGQSKVYVCRQGGGRGQKCSKICVRLLWMAPILRYLDRPIQKVAKNGRLVLLYRAQWREGFYKIHIMYVFEFLGESGINLFQGKGQDLWEFSPSKMSPLMLYIHRLLEDFRLFKELCI